MNLLRLAAFFAVAGVGGVHVGAQTRTDAPLRLSDAVVGSVVEYTVKPGDSLTRIGARMGVDVSTLRQQNGLDLRSALQPGQTLTVDNRHVVPGGVSDAVVVNIPQRMLFLFGPGDEMRGYPVAVGRPTWQTPTGSFSVLSTRVKPACDVPHSIQEEMRLNRRKPLAAVPPGPSNPLGDRWLGLSLPSAGIDGASAPQSIYTFRTHGCIRLHPDDIREVFERVSLQDAGEVIYEPVLMAQVGDRVFLEVHRDVYRRRGDPLLTIQRIAARCPIPELDWDKVRRVVESHDGIASDVTAGQRRRGRRVPSMTM